MATSIRNDAGEEIDWRQVKWSMFYERREDYLKSRAAGLNNFPLEEINRRSMEYANEACREQIMRRIVDARERLIAGQRKSEIENGATSESP